MTHAGPEKPKPGGTASGGAACPRERPAATGFSKDLSHDFRTPLNIIIGFSELLLEEIPGELNDEQRLDLTDILNSGRRLLDLVNIMLQPFESGARKNTPNRVQ
jgi:signal transduction histidine kinase